jgi:hypothetical protein
MNIIFTFNYYNNIININKNYINKTLLSIEEIIYEESLKQNIQLNLDNIIIYDQINNKIITNKNEILKNNNTHYKIIIKPISCNTHQISKY